MFGQMTLNLVSREDQEESPDGPEVVLKTTLQAHLALTSFRDRVSAIVGQTL